MYVDIWKPNDTVNIYGFICLLSSMYDMPQVVIIVGSKYIKPSYTARLFMEISLLKFSPCAIVVIDIGSEFCSKILYYQTRIIFTCRVE